MWTSLQQLRKRERCSLPNQDNHTSAKCLSMEASHGTAEAQGCPDACPQPWWHGLTLSMGLMVWNWLAVHGPSSFSASLWQNCQGPSPGLQFVTTSVNSVMVGEVSCSCSVPESSLESWAWLSQSMAHVPSQMLQYFFAVMKQQMYRQKHPLEKYLQLWKNFPSVFPLWKVQLVLEKLLRRWAKRHWHLGSDGAERRVVCSSGLSRVRFLFFTVWSNYKSFCLSLHKSVSRLESS